MYCILHAYKKQARGKKMLIRKSKKEKIHLYYCNVFV